MARVTSGHQLVKRANSTLSEQLSTAAEEQALRSAIYSGTVGHCRFTPKRHAFSYQVFMMYLDLDELETVFQSSRLWSLNGRNLASFRRRDFLGDPNVGLADAVKQRIYEEEGVRFEGSIRVLANLRYFGFIINPITCYYCFDHEERLAYIVAEVTNTPWNERHSYVLPCDPGSEEDRIVFAKAMHVSPFNDMAMEYDWRSNKPGENLAIHLENRRVNDSTEAGRLFVADMQLQRQPIADGALTKLILQYPLMTMKVAAGIYWQAAKLYFKGVPFVSHPEAQAESKNT